MDIALHEVSPSGRVNLGDLAKDVKFYKVQEPELDAAYPSGTLVLVPVNIVSASGKRTTADEVHDPYNSLPQG